MTQGRYRQAPLTSLTGDLNASLAKKPGNLIKLRRSYNHMLQYT